ncbi:MAG: endoglucanase [Alphaproteobacteria bacterium]|nr:endoglucanase [Alphaproteobacteria bacterium]
MRGLPGRIVFLLAAAGALATAGAAASADDGALARQWPTYRERFVGDDGRVRDTGNDGVSHTEGQGWAMLFAESFDDRATFDRIWGWTRDKLRRPDSALFAWRWNPNAGEPVADKNNATDGDMLIAWALTRAARYWHAPDYLRQARPILAEIRGKLVERRGGGLVLLPGSEGFRATDGSAIVNLSYYIYPALDAFTHADGSPQWARLRRSGLALLAKARFGVWGLPSDWVAVGDKGQVTPTANLPPRFGFDAIRIPLYLIWGGEATAPRLDPELRFWDSFADRPIPAWVDVTDGSAAPFAASSGFRAVIELVRAWRAHRPPVLPEIADKDDYYAASLILLAGLAARARWP